MATGAPAHVELARVGSTQDELRALALEGAAAWSTVRADEQLAGRGRRGRSWTARPGSALLASVLLRPGRPAEELGSLSVVAGVAACEVARGCGVEARLRWPNDVVVGDRKLAGVLAELIAGPAVILGVGLNASTTADELPPTDRLPATSLLLEGGTVPSPAELLERLLAALRPLVAAFELGGFAAVRPRAAALDALTGERVRLQLAGGRAVTGTGAGIDDTGALLLRTPAGLERHVSGEVARVR